MLLQIGFAQPRAFGAGGIRKLRHLDIGFDAIFLHAAPRRREIARRRQPQRRILAERNEGLHRAFAKTALAQHDGAALVLQRARDDFGGRSRALVDQHHNGLAVGQVTRIGLVTLNIILGAAALRNNFPLVEEDIADFDRLVEQATGVGAQIDDIAGNIGPKLFFDRCHGIAGRIAGLFVEGGDADHPHRPARFELHRLDLDDFAFQRVIHRLGGAFAHHGDLDRSARCTAHLVDRFLQGGAVDEFTIEVGDIIARFDAGACRWRIIGRRDNLDRAVFGGDRQSQPAIFAIGVLAHVLIFADIEIRRMRIKAGEHAVDGALDQFLVIGLVDIIGADAFKNVHQHVELLVGFAFAGGADRSSAGNRQHGDNGQGNHHALRHHDKFAFGNQQAAILAQRPPRARPRMSQGASVSPIGDRGAPPGSSWRDTIVRRAWRAPACAARLPGQSRATSRHRRASWHHGHRPRR